MENLKLKAEIKIAIIEKSIVKGKACYIQNKAAFE
jgi:hypothetical protein